MLNLPTDSDKQIIFIGNTEFTYEFKFMGKNPLVNMIFFSVKKILFSLSILLYFSFVFSLGFI